MSRFVTPAVILLVALIAAPVSAEQRKGDANSDQPRVESKSSLTDSVRRVERQTGGEVLSAEPVQRDGRQVNRVKVLTNDGRVRVVQVDPQQKNSGKKVPPVARTQSTVDSKDGGDPNLF